MATTSFTVAGQASGTVTSTGITSDTLVLGGTNPITTSGVIDVELPTSVSGHNLIINGDFQVWQRGTAFSIPSAGVAYTADRWLGQSQGTAAFGVTQVAGATSGSYLAKLQRNPGQTSTTAILMIQGLTRASCVGIQSQVLTVSFKALHGANFSAAGNLLNVSVVTGTGSTDIAHGPSTYTGLAGVITATTAITGTLTEYSFTSSTVNSNVTQATLSIYFLGVGTAGADDSVSITDVKMELGPIATPFVHEDWGTEAAKCYPFFQKSFEYTTAPTQNAGALTGEASFVATVAGASNNSSGGVYYPVPLNPTTAYTLTTYCPIASSSQMYGYSTGTPFTNTALRNKSRKMFELAGDAPSGTQIGYLCGVHWSVDGELY